MHFQGIRSYADSFFELLFPRVCYGCGAHLFENEHEVCNRCLRSLPRTGFELVDDNPVSRLFWGRIFVERSASVFYYRKGELLQKLFHRLKYRGGRKLGHVLGKQAGNILFQSGFTAGVDILIPVPLHEKKYWQRGYNQSELIAQGISEALKIPVVADNLIRTVYTESQTNKGRFERWENVSSIFALKDAGQLDGKHVLLIDDVVTTGATLEACVSALKSNADIKVSIATIGCAQF